MKKNLRIDIFMIILLLYTNIILLNDYICYFIKLPYIFSFLCSCILNGLIFWILSKKIDITNNIKKVDIIFFTVLFIIMAITIVFPDSMFDTFNYHLLNQGHPFLDLTDKYFFPSTNINSTTFALGDRMFYPFRILLGYRLGLIINYFALIVIYYQLKKIIKNLFNNDSVVALVSTLSIFTLSILDVIDTYYVDILSLVFILELFSLAFDNKKLNKDKSKNSLEFIYIGLLAGISFCMKLANAWYIIIAAIIYLINHKDLFKRINFKSIILTIITFIIPFLVYMIYTYIQTGNPVFPFYNNIFKSELFSNISWSDSRLGPKGIIEVFIWPIKMLLHPERANDVYIIEPIWAFGYIIAYINIILFIIKKLMKKQADKNLLLISISIILMTIVWGKFILGYVRYGLLILLLIEVIFYKFIYDSYKNKRFIILPILLIMIGYNNYYFINKYVDDASRISFNNIFANGKKSYLYNINHLFDKKYETIKLPDISAWGPIYLDSGYMYLLDDSTPIINLFIHKEGTSTEKYLELMNSKYDSYDTIYTVIDSNNLTDFIGILNGTGYKVSDYYNTYSPTYLNYNVNLYVFKIEKDADYVSTYEEKSLINVNITRSDEISGYAIFNEINEGTYFELTSEDSSGVKTIFKEKIDNNVYKFNQVINDNSLLKFHIVDKDGNELDKEFGIMNLKAR